MRNQDARMASRHREVARLFVTGSRSCLQASNAAILTALIIIAAASHSVAITVGQEARPTRLDAPTRPSWTLNDDSWNQWWSYSGVSGPSYWGLLNLDWFMCEKGRRQSPIDINTKALVYDPHLTPLKVDNNLISGVLYNDGHSIVFNGSLAAMTRLVRLQEQNQEQQAENNAIQQNELTTGENSTTTKIDHAISKRQTSDIFTLDEHTARVELVGLRSGFVVDTEDSVSNSALIRSQRPLMLIRELGNNVDLSISESDRLQSESSGFSAERSESTSADSAPPTEQVHFTGAGTVYSYRFETLQFKFGPSAVSLSSDAGSEHQIDGQSFAGELQLFAYNWQLYRSYDESFTRPHGLLAISILVDLIPDGNQNDNKGDPNGRLEASNQKSSSGENGQSRMGKTMTGNEQLERLLTSASNSLNYRGAFAAHRDLNLSALLSETEQFVTYEGSLTQPGCHETVTWLILNRPLYISKQILDKLRLLSSDESSAPIPTGTLIAGNMRPIQPVNNRPIRTNIRPAKLVDTATNMPDQEICPRLWTRYKYSRHNN